VGQFDSKFHGERTEELQKIPISPKRYQQGNECLEEQKKRNI